MFDLYRISIKLTFLEVLGMFCYEVNTAPGEQKHPPVPTGLLLPGQNHAITMRHIQEDQVTKFYLSTSAGLASRSFTNFFSQDLLRARARAGSVIGPRSARLGHLVRERNGSHKDPQSLT